MVYMIACGLCLKYKKQPISGPENLWGLDMCFVSPFEKQCPFRSNHDRNPNWTITQRRLKCIMGPLAKWFFWGSQVIGYEFSLFPTYFIYSISKILIRLNFPLNTPLLRQRDMSQRAHALRWHCQQGRSLGKSRIIGLLYELCQRYMLSQWMCLFEFFAVLEKQKLGMKDVYFG